MRTTAFLMTAAILVLNAGCPSMGNRDSVQTIRTGQLSRIRQEHDIASWAHRGGEPSFTVRAGSPEPRPKGVAKPEPLPHLAVMNPRKVVYTAEFTIVAADVRTALKQTKALARETGGYMQQMTSVGIVIRVPAQKFEEIAAALEKLGTVMHRDIKASDVTEDYVDLEIRLKNAQALLAKLLALLDKAGDVKEALAVEKEITRVRTEIEQVTGKLNKLKNQVTYATVSVLFVGIHMAPDELKVRLPFWWLRGLGLEELLRFARPL